MNNVPKLRFKEFSGEWEEKRLCDLSIKIGDGMHSTPVYSEKKEFFFINGNNINNKKIIITKDTKAVSEEEYLNHFIDLDLNTILISINGTIGNLGYYNNEKIILGKSSAYIKLKNIISKEYIYNCLQSHRVIQYFKGELTGSTIKNLSLSTLRGALLFLPTSTEQEKIADFLSKVDKKIEILEKKKELWEEYKKGTIQKIFSQELRFKDENGNEYPQWEEKILGEIAIIIMGQSPSSSNYNIEKSGLPLIQGNADCKNRRTVPRIYTREVTKQSKTNDIIMSVRAPAGTVAISTIDSCIGRGVCAIRSQEVSQEFLFQFLINYEKEWGKYSQGSTFESINSNDVKELNVFIPIFIEQEKIAKYLFAIDSKIEIIAKELDGINEFKKGLLQEMFI